MQYKRSLFTDLVRQFSEVTVALTGLFVAARHLYRVIVTDRKGSRPSRFRFPDNRMADPQRKARTPAVKSRIHRRRADTDVGPS